MAKREEKDKGGEVGVGLRVQTSRPVLLRAHGVGADTVLQGILQERRTGTRGRVTARRETDVDQEDTLLQVCLTARGCRTSVGVSSRGTEALGGGCLQFKDGEEGGGEMAEIVVTVRTLTV